VHTSLVALSYFDNVSSGDCQNYIFLMYWISKLYIFNTLERVEMQIEITMLWSVFRLVKGLAGVV
jgi:hypothetical protein